MELDSVIARNSELPAANVDRDIVFLNAAAGRYVALDEIGTRIWELLESPRPVGDLISELCEEFEGPRLEIREDVLGFLVELEQEGMVRVVADHAT